MIEQKTPPSSRESEEAFLGALLIGSTYIDEAIGIVRPEMFYYPLNQKVMQAIANVYNSKQPVDIITVTNELRRMGEESTIAVYVTELSSAVSGDYHIEAHSKIVVQKYINREAIRMSMEIQESAFDDNLDEVIIKASEMEDALLNNLSAVNAVSITEVFAANATHINERATGSHRDYIDCGIRAIDRVLGGFEPGNLIVIAGRPAMGKTAFAMQLAYNISALYPILFISLEMTKEEIGLRFLVALTDIDGIRLKRGENITAGEWKLIEEAGKELESRKMVVDDSAHLSVYNLRSKLFRMVRSKGIKVVFIDYLQLMEGQKGKDGSEYYGSISRTCKQVAKELKITIVLLSQLNRDVEKRGEKIPRLFDLRASGEIEQDADVVIFPVRCKFAGIDDPSQGLDEAKAIIAIAKNRNGEAKNVIINVSPNASQWYDESSNFYGPKNPPLPTWIKD